MMHDLAAWVNRQKISHIVAVGVLTGVGGFGGLWAMGVFDPPKLTPRALGPAATPGTTPAALTSPSLPPDRTAELPVMVYVTRSGKKYHRAGCRYLAKSAEPISLKLAIVGYSPCSVCSPPLK